MPAPLPPDVRRHLADRIDASVRVALRRMEDASDADLVAAAECALGLAHALGSDVDLAARELRAALSNIPFSPVA